MDFLHRGSPLGRCQKADAKEQLESYLFAYSPLEVVKTNAELDTGGGNPFWWRSRWKINTDAGPEEKISLLQGWIQTGMNRLDTN